MMFQGFMPMVLKLWYAIYLTMPFAVVEPCYTDTQCLLSCEGLWKETSVDPGCDERCTKEHQSCLKGCKLRKEEEKGRCLLDCINLYYACIDACQKRSSILLLLKPGGLLL